METLLMTESPRLPWGSTLVVVTAVITDDLLAALLRLRDVGRRLVLISLEERPSPMLASISGVLTYHLPASELPFDDSFLGEPEAWAPDIAPPLRFAGESG
jgi:hypothetical protein